jgi:hypothetical protein
MTAEAPRALAIRQGFRPSAILTIVISSSRKTTSIGKRMKCVWMKFVRESSTPFPGGSFAWPIRPRKRLENEVATRQSRQRTSPSARRTVRTSPTTLVRV